MGAEIGVQEPARLTVEAAGMLRVGYQEAGTEQAEGGESMSLIMTVDVLVGNGCERQILMCLERDLLNLSADHG